jgi:hypothetical protein
MEDPDGPFDAPMSIPKESMTRSEAKGVDPLDFGVNIMLDRTRAWDAPCTEAFVRDTPRLVVDAPASGKIDPMPSVPFGSTAYAAINAFEGADRSLTGVPHRARRTIPQLERRIR